jgi:hypothetical protein
LNIQSLLVTTLLQLATTNKQLSFTTTWLLTTRR